MDRHDSHVATARSDTPRAASNDSLAPGAVERLASDGRWAMRRITLKRYGPRSVPADANCVLVSIDNPIPASQIYPFYHFARALKERLGLRVAELDAKVFESATVEFVHPQVRWVFFQTWFDFTDERAVAFARTLRRRFPEAKLAYLDWFAPLTLGYGRALADHVDVYCKKQIYRDLSRYNAPVLGDTNLTDYYARRYGIELPLKSAQVPDRLFPKLALMPSFFLARYLLATLREPLEASARPVDVHARMATGGEHWYARMREEASKASRSMPGTRVLTDGKVPRKRFMQELRESKLCFSPFGYGEVCWRDYEAIVSGAALVKPSMDHLLVSPDIFVAHRTYVPIAWDYSDYSRQVRTYLDDTPRRLAMTAAAHRVLSDYVADARFVDDVRSILERAEGRA